MQIFLYNFTSFFSFQQIFIAGVKSLGSETIFLPKERKPMPQASLIHQKLLSIPGRF